MGHPALSITATLLLALGACGGEPIDLAVRAQELRPDDPAAGALPESFPADAQVDHVDGEEGTVRVHFMRDGRHAAEPEYAAAVASEYEAALRFYTSELGFMAPLPDDTVEGNDGGDARLDVYLIDFATSADGAFRADACLADEPQRCAGYIVHENDFDGRGYRSLAEAHRTVASHELFHAIQNAYAATTGVVLGEGSAVWASEAYAPELEDFERLIPGYLERPERSLAQEPTGPVDAFSYGSALFFRFLEERYGRDALRLLWEELSEEGAAVDAASWTAALDSVLHDEYASSLAEAYEEHVRWNLYTGARADTTHSYEHGARYPQLVEREVSLPFTDDRVRVFPLSSRHFTAEVAVADEIALEVLENEAPIIGLRLMLAMESGGELVKLEAVDVASATRVSLRAERGDRVHAVLINTQRDGESLQPALCLARVGEHTPCQGELPVADGGVPDAAADEEQSAAAAGGGCVVAAGGRTPRLFTLIAWGFVALALARRLMLGHAHVTSPRSNPAIALRTCDARYTSGAAVRARRGVSHADFTAKRAVSRSQAAPCRAA